jgi:tetratricopeptide (TPR) repeat protein
MRDCPSDETLAALLEGGLSEDERALLSEHMAGCPDCREIASEGQDHSESGTTVGVGAHPRPKPRRRLLPPELDFQGTPRFEVRSRIGAGGMGVVYEAFDRERKAVVALKALREVDAETLYLFKNEFRCLADLHHPNLVQLGELFCEEEQWFFTMELVAGFDLLGYLRPNGRPDLGRIRAAFLGLARGVAALHASGRVHRDIKPSNIRVSSTGRVVLLDFGLSTLFTEEPTHPGVPVVRGTPLYMAPEQARGEPAGPPADWYAVGAVLYHALAGEPPHGGAPSEVLRAKREQPPRPPADLTGDVPADLASLCLDLLHADAAARSTGDEVLQRLGGLAAPARAPAAPFVGRTAELALLHTAFEDSRAGQAVAVFVHGESGLGKTTLVQRFVESLHAHPGTVVLAGRCYERESVPYKAFDGVVDALCRSLVRLDAVDAAVLLPRDTQLLSRVFPVLRRVPAVERFPRTRDTAGNLLQLRARAFAAMRELLSKLADRGPLVVVIDDLQWADADSLALLGALLQPPGAPPLLLVGTVRTEDHSREGLEAAAARLGDVRRIVLGALLPEEASSLVRQLAGKSPAVEAAAQSIALEAGGHPLFIREIVQHFLEEGGALPSLRLDEALWARIGRLDESASRVIQLLAIAASPLAPEVLARAADLEPSAVSAALSVLRAQHLIRGAGAQTESRIEPYHDRVRHAVMAHVPLEARRERHRDLALAFELTTLADPRVLVHHLEAAGEPERAADLAEQAARRASEALAFDLAAELYGTALRLGGGEEARPLQLRLADALALAGRGAEAADAYLSAAIGADAATRFECHRRASEQLLGCGYVERGLELLKAVVAELGERMPETQQSAFRSVVWQRILIGLRGLRWKRRAESDLPARDLTRIDTFFGVGVTLWPMDPLRGVALTLRSLRLALRAGEPSRVAQALCAEAGYQAQRGRHERALDLIARALRIARDLDRPDLVTRVSGAEGLAHLLSGRFSDAVVKLAERERLHDPMMSTPHEIALIRQLRLMAMYYTGSFRELCRIFDEILLDAIRRGDRWSAATLVRGGSLAWLVRDEPERARRAFAEWPWELFPGEFHYQQAYELNARCEVALYEGEGGHLLEQFGPEIAAALRMHVARWEIMRLRANELCGRLALADAAVSEHPEPLLREARRRARRLRRSGRPYALAWATLIEAGISARVGDARTPLLLREAVATAEAHGLVACAMAARWRLGEWLGGEEGRAQRETAERWFAAEGVKNPGKIAALFTPGHTPAAAVL